LFFSFFLLLHLRPGNESIVVVHTFLFFFVDIFYSQSSSDPAFSWLLIRSSNLAGHLLQAAPRYEAEWATTCIEHTHV
jgi:hypothetical protein